MSLSNPLAMTLSGVALQRQHTLVINDYPAYQYRTTPEIRAAGRAEGVISAMIAPMFLGWRLVGFVNVGNRRRVAFGAVHSSLLSTLAAQASVAMVNGMLQRELRARNAMLAESLTVHRELTASAVRGAGAAGLLERLEQILDRPVELTTEPTDLDRHRGDTRVPVLARDDCLGWVSTPGAPLATRSTTPSRSSRPTTRWTTCATRRWSTIP
ncbi:hypothetical protein DSM104299_05101 [Baekduia alba]|uniref:GAF domain-containing protein n=1 Tax=Baekduia alba TaxID=2997333 RepID=UPI002340E42B|nr:GAF domain-containing protein [Baekduia alba]WCB96344.1 hypothetical protein DSM104299_05101 [Baekduia alba]